MHIGQFTKGQVGAFKGRNHTRESKMKMALASLGREPTFKQIQALVEGRALHTKLVKSPDYWTDEKREQYSKIQIKVQKRGEEHHLWKGGKTKDYQHLNSSFRYKHWRKQVFERDDYTCKMCNSDKVYITAHHIKSWAKYPELRYEVSNGLTLCEPCHSQTDNYKSKGRIGVYN